MPSCHTRDFGPAEYSEDSVIRMQRGPFGFENESGFVLIHRPELYPLVSLQSVSTPGLCFLALPVFVVDSRYDLRLTPEDAAVIAVRERPAIGTEVLCLALLTVHPEGPTANLLAPVVVNLNSRAALQCLNTEEGYSHQHPLVAAQQGVPA
jgi:flagellar assembly factor FliW